MPIQIILKKSKFSNLLDNYKLVKILMNILRKKKKLIFINFIKVFKIKPWNNQKQKLIIIYEKYKGI